MAEVVLRPRLWGPAAEEAAEAAVVVASPAVVGAAVEVVAL